jgi:N-acetylneuraminate synthase
MKNRIRIGDRWIGPKEPTFIIAEAGSNHDGSLEVAKRMVEVAKEANADAIKFQLFRAETLYPNKSIEVKYLRHLGIKENLYSIIKRLEVPYEWVATLSGYARENHIEFMATPFDLEAVQILNPYVNVFKIASYESLYADLINEIKKTNKPLLISTGGCSEDTIDLLVKKLLFDYKDRTVLLHCIAKYPAPIEQTNLNIIPRLSKKYGIAVGYSDHTPEPILAPVAAVALGARVIEKHFTLSRKSFGPDHAFAIEPDELKAMVNAIRSIEKGITSSNKRLLQKCEGELYFYRRCIYCNRDLREGERISRSDLIILRNTGEKCNYFNPTEIDYVVGKALRRDRKANEIIRREDVE